MQLIKEANRLLDNLANIFHKASPCVPSPCRQPLGTTTSS